MCPVKIPCIQPIQLGSNGYISQKWGEGIVIGKVYQLTSLKFAGNVIELNGGFSSHV